MNWVLREQQRQESNYNAGSKARMDVDSILTANGYKPLIANIDLDTSQMLLKKVRLQFSRYFEWSSSLKVVSSGDTVVIQYPVRNHTLFFSLFLRKLRNKKVKTIGIIHDLESLRQAIDKNNSLLSKIRFSIEEISALKYFTNIIVHNQCMIRSIHDRFGIPTDKMINLEIFDYLYTPENEHVSADVKGPVIVAGSLDKNKAGYIYDLPDDVKFDLYGANIDINYRFNSNVIYKGKVKPDVLPSVLKGSYGLVWDGPSAKSCEGVFGEYLRINNPHKTSLYLAAGLPVIVWRESALASFILNNGCGIAVNSLETLSRELGKISTAEYEAMRHNVDRVGNMIRQGGYLKKAIGIVPNKQL